MIPEIKIETDHDRFHLMPFNRQVTDTKMLKKSIGLYDLTKYNPILVDRQFRIIDGQNRFLVEKELGLPVYYTIFEGSDEDAIDAMIALNTAVRGWRTSDWLHFFVEKGNETYARMEKLMELYKVDISVARTLFSNGKTSSSDFKKGNLIDDSKWFGPTRIFIEDCILPETIKKTERFNTAVMRFLQKYDGQPKTIRKLKNKITAISKFGDVYTYMMAFENLLKL